MKEKMKQLAGASLEKMTSMEKRLAGALQPIKPRREFVSGVASRIRSQAIPTRIAKRIASWHIIAILAAGLVSAAVFLAVLGRAIVSLLSKKRTA
jgi:hypothetical protein